MKFASYILNFNQGKWLLPSVEMISPYVERIFIAWSDKPWGEKKGAREKFKNMSDPALIPELEKNDKVRIIKGDWTTERAERNECLRAALDDGADYLFSFDADEFYLDQDIQKAIDFIKKNPNYDVYRTKCVDFWKDLDHVIMTKHGIVSPRKAGHTFIVNLRRGNRFATKRHVSGKAKAYLDIASLHMSYVLSDEECWAKLNTGTIKVSVGRKKWFEEKWLGWDENTTDLHQCKPEYWVKAVKRPDDIRLPDVLLKVKKSVSYGT